MDVPRQGMGSGDGQLELVLDHMQCIFKVICLFDHMLASSLEDCFLPHRDLLIYIRLSFDWSLD